MGKTKSPFWKRLLLFVILETSLVIGMLYCWGFYGQVHETRFRYMVKYLPQGQKEKLSEALNFYYNRGLAKYTTGIILRCEPETESIINQFLWFNKNTFMYYATDTPSYHSLVASALDYFDLLEDGEENLSTYDLERKLIRWYEIQAEANLTDKDRNSFLFSLIDAGTSLLVGSSTPVGLSVSALSLLQKAGSDPAKAIPAIVVFKKQREINFYWSTGGLTLLNLLFVFILIRRKK